MNIAIFGGSFDPIHLAHVAIVQKALEQLNIDKLIIVPTYLNPLKKDFQVNPHIRYELLKKVFSKFEKVEVEDFEINLEKYSYSINTVKYLKNKYNCSKIYFIIGLDNLENLDKWYKIEELKLLVEFIVATRNGYDNTNLNNYKKLNVNIDISSTKLREKLDIKYLPDEIKKDILNLYNK